MDEWVTALWLLNVSSKYLSLSTTYKQLKWHSPENHYSMKSNSFWLEGEKAKKKRTCWSVIALWIFRIFYYYYVLNTGTISARFKSSGNVDSEMHLLIAAPEGSFIAPHIWEIVVRKTHNFQMLPLFSILYDDFLKFSENRDKEFKLVPMYFNFPCTGNYIIVYLNIRSGHEIEAAIRWLS